MNFFSLASAVRFTISILFVSILCDVFISSCTSINRLLCVLVCVVHKLDYIELWLRSWSSIPWCVLYKMMLIISIIIVIYFYNRSMQQLMVWFYDGDLRVRMYTHVSTCVRTYLHWSCKSLIVTVENDTSDRNNSNVPWKELIILSSNFIIVIKYNSKNDNNN